MGVHVTHRAHETARRGHKQIVVAADDTEPGRMCQGGSVHNAGGRCQDVTVVHDDTVAVRVERRVNGAGRRVLSVHSGNSSCGEGSEVLIAGCA